MALARAVAAATLLAAVFATDSVAKSDPHLVTVTGPGLDEPIVLGTDGQGRGWPHAATLALAAGLQTAIWGEPRHMLRHSRPPWDLGPRYVARYRFSDYEIRQDLYPYARPRAVSYTYPGQRGYAVSIGGWYVEAPVLRDTLVYAGLPERRPSDPGPRSTLVALALGLIAAVAAARRRTMRRGGDARSD